MAAEPQYLVRVRKDAPPKRKQGLTLVRKALFSLVAGEGLEPPTRGL